MTRKLTLTIEENIIELAKKYALKNGISLSELIEDYLKILTAKVQLDEKDLTPKVKKLLGSIKSTGGDYKGSLTKAISRKYS